MAMGTQNETRTTIMEATYDALVEHGYADLTIQAIADEFDRSKSLLYYHYDSKDDIMRAFLSFVLEEFSNEMDTEGFGQDPEADIERLVDAMLPPDEAHEERALRLALTDLQLQSAYEETFREEFRELLDGLRQSFVDVLRAGVADGTFREDLDPEREAELLFATVSGASLHELTVDPGAQDRTRAAVEDHIERLLAD